jgi:hypothetical protein
MAVCRAFVRSCPAFVETKIRQVPSCVAEIAEQSCDLKFLNHCFLSIDFWSYQVPFVGELIS